jgi:hypothetical protein
LWQFESDVHEHTGRELKARIRDDHAGANGARRHVHLGIKKVHAALEDTARIRVHGERRAVADLDSSQVILKNFRQNPDGRKIGDGIEARFRLNSEIWESVTLRDEPGDGGFDRELLLDPARGFEPRDFFLRHAPLL